MLLIRKSSFFASVSSGDRLLNLRIRASPTAAIPFAPKSVASVRSVLQLDRDRFCLLDIMDEVG